MPLSKITRKNLPQPAEIDFEREIICNIRNAVIKCSRITISSGWLDVTNALYAAERELETLLESKY